MGASEVFKNQGFKSQLFSSSQKKYLKLKTWLDFNAIIGFINNIKNLHQFSEKHFKSSCLIYKSFFALKYYPNFIIN